MTYLQIINRQPKTAEELEKELASGCLNNDRAAPYIVEVQEFYFERHFRELSDFFLVGHTTSNFISCSLISKPRPERHARRRGLREKRRKPIKYLQWAIVMKGYYFVLVKYISGRCAIVDRQYSTYSQALAAAKRRMRRRAIVEAYIYQQMSIQDVQQKVL